MALTKVQTIGIETGISLTGVTTVTTLNASTDTLSVGGTVNFGGNVSIAGTLTYEDVTNIDAVGLITARNGIEVTDKGVQVGTGATVDSAADNVLTFLTNGSERVRVTSAGRVGIGTDDPQQDVQIDSSTETTLSLYEGGQKFGALQIQGSSNFGTILYSYNGNPLIFSTNSGSGFARALTIDTSQRVLIGTTTEGAANADNLTIADSGHAGMTIRSGTSSKGAVFFSDATSGSGEYEGVVEYNHSDNNMLFFTSGSEALRIDSSGQVILNNSASSGDATILRITGGTNGSSVIEMGDTADTDIGQIAYYQSSNAMAFRVNASERMRINSSGNIGIANNNPTTGRLVVGSTSDSSTAINITSSTSGSGLLSFSDTNSGQGGIRYFHSTDHMGFYAADNERMRIDSSGNLNLVSSSSTLTDLNFTASDLSVYARVEGGKSGSGVGDLRFHIYSGGLSEAMRIDSSGRLLVGSVSALDTTAGAITSNNSSSGGRLALGGNPSSAGSSVGEVFGWWNGNKVAGLVAASGADTTNKDDGELLFYTSASGPSVQERMRITRSGNIGIGDNAPGQKFVVKDAGSSSTSAYINVISGNAANAGIAFGDTGADLEGGILYNHADDALRFFKNGFTEAARIDSSGRLLLGATSTIEGSANNLLQIEADNSAPGILFGRNDSTISGGDTMGTIQWFGNDGGSYQRCAFITAEATLTHANDDKPTALVFATTGDNSSTTVERLRIGSQGHQYAECRDTSLASLTLRKGVSGADSIDYLQCRSNSNSAKMVIKGDGDLENSNNNYSGFSDLKLKENIVDASSQWDDIKAIQIRNYNFKEETGYQTHTQLGVIAQEIETVSSGLVSESPDRDEDGNDLGTVTKSVKYSVLYMKAVKALQEAQTRIESLESRLDAAGL